MNNKNRVKKKCNYLGSNSLLLSVNNPAPVKYEMGNGVYGSYDGIKLIANKNDGWRQEPANVPLKPSDYLFVQGTPLPLKNEMIYTQLPEDSMFYFSHNRALSRMLSIYFLHKYWMCMYNTWSTCIYWTNAWQQ